MVSKQNQRLLLEERSDKREFHYGLRKLTVGVASVLLGTTVFLGGQAVHADTVNSEDVQTQAKQPVASEFSANSASATSNQVPASESLSSTTSSGEVNNTQNVSQGVNQAPLSVNRVSARMGSQVNANVSNTGLPGRKSLSSASDLPATNSSANFGSSASAVSKVQKPASNVIRPVAPRRMVMAANDSHYQMNKVVSTGRDLWMAFDVPFVWYQPSQLGNGVLALGDGHHNGELAPWKFQVYTQWHRDLDNGQWQFISGYTSDPAHYALETSEVKILGSQSQNGHTFTMAALPITVNAYTLKDQLQSGGYYIMVPGLNAQAGLDQSSGSWTASIPVGANGQIPLVRLGVTVSKIQYVTGTNHDQVISSVNVHQDIIRNGTAQAVNLPSIPSGYRLEYMQPTITPRYTGYIPDDQKIDWSNCIVSINSDNTLIVSVPVTNSNIPADNNIKVNTAIDVVTDANYTPAVPYLPSGVTLGNPSDSTSDNSWLDSFSYDTATQTIHTSGWHASNKAKGAKYHYIVLWDDTDKVVLAKKAVQANMRPDVQKVHPNEFNALYSGWDTSFAITSPYMQTHTLKVISEYTTDPEGNNVVVSNIFDRTNIDNITKLDINKVNYAANQQVHHLVYLTDQTKQYTTSNTMQKSDFVHSDSGLTQLDKDVLGQPMVIDWDHPTIQNSSTVYSDGLVNKTAAFGQKVDVTFDGDTVVYTAHLGESRRYQVIEDLPNDTQKIVYEIDATVLKHSDGKYYADALPTSGTYNSSHYSATINPSSSTGQVYFESTDPGYAAMVIDDLPGYTWSVVPNASLGSNYSQGISFMKAYMGTKIGNYTCNGNELIFDLLFGMNKYNSIAPSGDIHIHYTGHSQTATINYIDTATNKILHTDMITGLSDLNSGYTTAKEIGILVGQGYQVVSDSTNGSAVVYDHADNVNQTFIVRLSHKYVPVEPGQPILPGQKTSGGKTIDGGHQSDLYKIVTRTIVLKTPGQADQTIIQTVKLTRSASVDEVTGHVTYGTWSTGSWPDYHVPAKAHYTADKTMIASQMVDDTTVDQTVTVSYSLNKAATQYTITVKYVDDDNNGALVGKAVTVSGNNVDFNLSIPANYGLVVGQAFPTKVDASVNGKSYVVHLCHLKEITARYKLVKRVINYVDEQGHSLHQSVTQNAGIIVEYGNKDLVAGDVVWGQYHADVYVGDVGGAFPEYHLPQYKGFTSYVNGIKSTVIPKAYVTYDANGKPVQLNTTVEVTYQSDKDLSNPSQPETDSESNDDQSGDTLTARRFINIDAPDGTTFVNQSISFVKDHDQKTLAAVTNPQIAGYYTSSQQIDGVTVDYESVDKLVKTVNVVYHLVPESLQIHFYDVDGNLIQSANVNGKYGQTIDVHSVLPAGWQLYADQIVPNAVKLGVYNADLAFVLDHKIAEIKPEMNVSTTDAIPGTNYLTYPSEVLSSNLNRDLVYTVNIKHPDGKVEPKVFKRHVSRSAYLDLVTGKVIGYSKWTNNGRHMFNAFVAHPKDGYMIDTLPAVTLDIDHPTKTVDVSYVPKTINGQVVYKTFVGQTIDTQSFIGNQFVNFVVPTGYKLATNVASLQPTNEADQKYIVYVIPQVITYTSHDDNKPANIGDLTKIVTRTININLPNGRIRTIKQNVRFERITMVKADGSVEYSNWQATGRTVMNKVFLPKRRGYRIVIDGDLAKLNATADMSNSVVNAKYVKD